MSAAALAMTLAAILLLLGALVWALARSAGMRARAEERILRMQANQEVAHEAEKILDAPKGSLDIRRANAARRRELRETSS